MFERNFRVNQSNPSNQPNFLKSLSLKNPSKRTEGNILNKPNSASYRHHLTTFLTHTADHDSPRQSMTVSTGELITLFLNNTLFDVSKWDLNGRGEHVYITERATRRTVVHHADGAHPSDEVPRTTGDLVKYHQAKLARAIHFLISQHADMDSACRRCEAEGGREGDSEFIMKYFQMLKYVLRVHTQVWVEKGPYTREKLKDNSGKLLEFPPLPTIEQIFAEPSRCRYCKKSHCDTMLPLQGKNKFCFDCLIETRKVPAKEGEGPCMSCGRSNMKHWRGALIQFPGKRVCLTCYDSLMTAQRNNEDMIDQMREEQETYLYQSPF